MTADTEHSTDNVDAFSLRDRVALVTGASSGIGLHLAGVFARAGAAVALAARRKERIDAAAARLGFQFRLRRLGAASACPQAFAIKVTA